jgi:arylsulfatase A-like enzyme
MRQILTWYIFGMAACTTAYCAGAQTLCNEDPAASPAKPNVLLIVADDLGYGQLSCYPHVDAIPTPGIDRLAETGVTMTAGYSAHPMCWPSRASILTGRYYQRFLKGRVIPEEEKQLAAYLREAGYATACVGKWHNVAKPGPYNEQADATNHPLSRGFGEFFGFLGGMHYFFDWNLGVKSPNKVYMPIYDGFEVAEGDKYLTTEFTDRAIDFITQHQEHPFFLYLPYNAIHTPYEAPEKYLDRYPDDPHKAMLAALDDDVGRLLDLLDELGIARNTMVLFIGDNGGYGDRPGKQPARYKNWKLRAGKGVHYEGGIRVPFLIAWPAGLPQGRVYRQPVMHIDLLPTILAAAGIDVPQQPQIDGKNLLPHLRGEIQDPPHETLFFGDTKGNRYVVLRGNWKLIKEREGRDDPPQLGLHNLKEDVSEQNNLLEQQKQIAEELEQLYREWADAVVPER